MSKEIATETHEKYPNRFKPGQSGNPSGRPKRSKEEQDTLEKIKGLSKDVPDIMKEMLDAPHVSSLAKVRIIEIILERTFGRVETNVKLESVPSLEAAHARIAAIIDHVRLGDGSDYEV